MSKIKNSLIIGKPGSGKTCLLSDLLNRSDVASVRIFVFGRLKEFRIGSQTKEMAEFYWYNSFPGDSEGDVFYELAYEDFMEYAGSGNNLVIIDEGISISRKMAQYIAGDLLEGKIKFWLSLQSFKYFEKIWDVTILERFQKFYLLHTRRQEDFIDHATLNAVNNLSPYDYLEFSDTDFVSKLFQQHILTKKNEKII